VAPKRQHGLQARAVSLPSIQFVDSFENFIRGHRGDRADDDDERRVRESERVVASADATAGLETSSAWRRRAEAEVACKARVAERLSASDY
jgi:hypothetical protein